MKERFQGTEGRERLIEALVVQKLVAANRELANELAATVELIEVDAGEIVISQGAEDDDVYLILSGSFGVHVFGKPVSHRVAGDSIGEMAAVQLAQPRAATVAANEKSVLAKLKSTDLIDIGKKYPEIYRAIAQDLSRRLDERNRLVTAARQESRVFVVSSTEGLPIARAVQDAFARDPFLTVVWENGVFKISNYPLESLEAELDLADFAIAIGSPDDKTVSRGRRYSSPRDNVTFELAYFMGRLGRKRTILMLPSGVRVKVGSDLDGLTTVRYKFEPGPRGPALIAPACHQIRDHVLALGPMN